MRVIDCMPLPRRAARRRAHRRGHARPGRRCGMELVIRFDYGSVVPWVRGSTAGISAIAGPGRAPAAHAGADARRGPHDACAEFEVAAGERVPFVLTWYPSHRAAAAAARRRRGADRDTEPGGRDWSERCTARRPWRDAVMRSLITLKALTYAPDRRDRRRADHLAARAARRRRATGTTATAGCATRRSRCSRCIDAGYSTRRRLARLAAARRRPAGPTRLQIMYGAGRRAPADRAASWTGCPATRAPRRCASATPPRAVPARRLRRGAWTRCYQAREAGLEPDDDAWRSAARAARASSRRSGASPTRASGRCAARGGTSRTPR